MAASKFKTACITCILFFWNSAAHSRLPLSEESWVEERKKDDAGRGQAGRDQIRLALKFVPEASFPQNVIPGWSASDLWHGADPETSVIPDDLVSSLLRF